MELEKLKAIVNNFQNGLVYDNNPDYVSLILIQDILKRKHQEFLDKTKEYVDYLCKKLKIKLDSFDVFGILTIRGKEKVFNPLVYDKFITILEHTIEIYFNTGSIRWRIDYRDIRREYIEEIEQDEKTKDYLNFVREFKENYCISYFYLVSNLGFRVSIEHDYSKFNIFVSDDVAEKREFKSIFSEDWLKQLKATLMRNFYYYKNILDNKRDIAFNNDEVKQFLNEEIIGKIYAFLKIDIASFPRRLQEEIKQAQISLKAVDLSDKENEEMLATKELQLQRILKTYELIKEATELLSLAKSDIGFNKIKLSNINSILFKNNGLPNSLGFIEFEEFFKNNMVLRMLDLSDVDLTNVDIRGMDFSGTNIHINPQIIYNKDMSYVNATDVKFSPFFDSFEGVILDGAIINDYEASVDFEKLCSYNSDTNITMEVIKRV